MYTQVYTHAYEHCDPQNLMLGTESDSREELKSNLGIACVSNRAADQISDTNT